MVLDGCVILLVTFCDVLSLSLFWLKKNKKDGCVSYGSVELVRYIGVSAKL